MITGKEVIFERTLVEAANLSMTMCVPTKLKLSGA